MAGDGNQVRVESDSMGKIEVPGYSFLPAVLA